MNEEKIKCVICNQEMTMLNNKHLIKHNLTLDQYRELYPDVKWRCDSIAEKQKQNAIKINESRKGIPRSEETKKKISEHNKGQIAHNKGKKMNDEQLEKHRETIKLREERRIAEGRSGPRKGAILTNETKEKLRQANLGKTLPQETIDKIVATRKRNGKKYTKKPHTEETKEKLRQYNINMRQERNEKLIEKYKIKAEEANLIILDYWSNVSNKLSGNLKCTKCDSVFERTLQVFNENKFHKEICIKCFPPLVLVSKQEKDLVENVRNFYSGLIIENDRTILKNRKELDIYFPEINLAIEYCGLYWHSEQMGKNNFYHVNKYNECKEKGINLITIFESDWVLKKDIVLSILKAKLGIFTKRIYARNCIIKEISSKDCSLFLQENHLKGKDKSSVRYGLYFDNELISVMTFSSKSLSRKIYDWEISRFCNKLNYTIVGGASKLFSKFITTFNPNKIITYSDLKYGEGNVYKHLKFIKKENTVPGYWYFKPNDLQLIHRFTLRKKSNEPKDITEKQLRENEGYLRIYDCGNAKFEWNKGD